MVILIHSECCMEMKRTNIYRTRARERNVGWRLDYFFVNEEFKDYVKASYIKSDIMGSDHCPIALEIEI